MMKVPSKVLHKTLPEGPIIEQESKRRKNDVKTSKFMIQDLFVKLILQKLN